MSPRISCCLARMTTRSRGCCSATVSAGRRRVANGGVGRRAGPAQGCCSARATTRARGSTRGRAAASPLLGDSEARELKATGGELSCWSANAGVGGADPARVGCCSASETTTASSLCYSASAGGAVGRRGKGRRAARGAVGRRAGPAPPCCSARATTTGGERNCWPTRDSGATAELLDARARGDGRVERLVGPPVRRPLLLG